MPDIGPAPAADAPGPPVADADLAVVRIDSLREGDQVDGLMACANKAIVTSRSGTPFLAIELRDGKRSIPGRRFSDVSRLARQFERGDVVRVLGSVASYRDELQIWIEEISRSQDHDGSAFLPVAYRDLDELDGFLEHLAREHVYQPGYRALLGSLLADRQLRRAWRRAPCTHDGHHAYLGGLLEHTVSVAILATETSALHPRLDSDLLVAAALVHDLGHTRAFTYGARILPSAEGRLLGHLQLGLEIVREHARRARLGDRLWPPLAHCVLAHHGPGPIGRRAITSPEAIALYRLNAVDTDVQRALEAR